jgi:hypothetical protein
VTDREPVSKEHTTIYRTINDKKNKITRLYNLKGPSSGSVIDAFQQQGQQDELPDVKFWKSNKTYLQVRL